MDVQCPPIRSNHNSVARCLILLELEDLRGDAALADELDLHRVARVDVPLRHRHEHVLHDGHRLLGRDALLRVVSVLVAQLQHIDRQAGRPTDTDTDTHTDTDIQTRTTHDGTGCEINRTARCSHRTSPSTPPLTLPLTLPQSLTRLSSSGMMNFCPEPMAP